MKVCILFAVAMLFASAVRAEDPWHLQEPLWSSKTIHGESVLFLQTDKAAPPNARLLLPIEKVIKVSRADGTQTFEEGKDYILHAAEGRLELPAGSRILSLNADELFPPAGAPRSIDHKAEDPTRSVLFDNGHWFHDHQVEVTYEPAEPWKGYRPERADKYLPRTLAKLNRGEPLTIGVSGDSITCGANASGVTSVPPKQPGYAQLVADSLQHTFGSKVSLFNRAEGGWRVENGLTDLPKLLETKPDLLILAYGMNHVGGRDAEGFRKLTGTMIDHIREANADIEIILVAPMHGNHRWVHTPAGEFPLHRDVIASFVGPGIAMADLTTLWGQMLERKRDSDLTGNGVNHPNDFGHRLYAQTILGLLSKK